VKITVSTEQLATNSETPPRQLRLFCGIWQRLAGSSCRKLTQKPANIYRLFGVLSEWGAGWYGVDLGRLRRSYLEHREAGKKTTVHKSGNQV